HGGDVVTITAQDTATDSSGACYLDPVTYTFDSDSNSLSLQPFYNSTAGTALQEATYNGSTWTYNANIFHRFRLILQPGNEFPASASLSSGIPTPRMFIGE